MGTKLTMKCTVNGIEIQKVGSTKTQPRQTFDKLNYKSFSDCAGRNLFYQCPSVKRIYLDENIQCCINMSIGWLVSFYFVIHSEHGGEDARVTTHCSRLHTDNWFLRVRIDKCSTCTHNRTYRYTNIAHTLLRARVLCNLSPSRSSCFIRSIFVTDIS